MEGLLTCKKCLDGSNVILPIQLRNVSEIGWTEQGLSCLVK